MNIENDSRVIIKIINKKKKSNFTEKNKAQHLPCTKLFAQVFESDKVVHVYLNSILPHLTTLF